MTKSLIKISKLFQILVVTTFLSSVFYFASNAEARQGCRTGYHPNPYNPSQCVANGTTGLGGQCKPGQEKWYDPRTKQWYPCKF